MLQEINKSAKYNIRKLFLPTVILSTFIFMIFGLSSAGDKNVAVIYKTVGKSTVIKANPGEQIEAKKGMFLDSGDKIRVEKGGFLVIRFLDGSSLLKVRENTEFKVEGTKEKDKTLAKRLEMQIGDVLASVVKSKGSFEVATPTSVASVKGTDFITVVDEQGNTTVIVLDGTIQVTDKKTGESKDTKKGESAQVTSTGGVNISQTDPNTIQNYDTPGDKKEEKEVEIEFENKDKSKKILKIKIK